MLFSDTFIFVNHSSGNKTNFAFIKTLASIIYIYLATVTKAITFGGFLGDITDGLQVWLDINHCLITESVAGSFGILPWPLVSWRSVLPTGGSASHSSWMYWTCSYLWEDFGGILCELWNLLPYHASVDWTLVSLVLYHHCGCGWVGYC